MKCIGRGAAAPRGALTCRTVGATPLDTTGSQVPVERIVAPNIQVPHRTDPAEVHVFPEIHAADGATERVHSRSLPTAVPVMGVPGLHDREIRWRPQRP